MGALSEVKKNSVTFGDLILNQNGIMLFMMPGSVGGLSGLPIVPPPWWSFQRDDVLRLTPLYESFWAGAVNIAVTKMSSMSFQVKSEIKLRANKVRELLLGAEDGKGWVPFLSRHLQDYLCTDNGAFIEVVRASQGMGSRILGIMHLDSRRCTRTGDPTRPVIYRDQKGVEHWMKPWQVISLSDLPSSSETYFGVGVCAASRAYGQIYKQVSVERFIAEKVSGRRPLAVHIVGGILETQLRTALSTAEEEATRKGMINYMGAAVIPVPGDVSPTLVTVPFAELPNGFNRKEEMDISLLAYANAIGLDPQDLQPLTGRPIGSGQQSQTLDDKALGKGLAAWRQEFTHDFNEWIVPDLTTMFFVERDFRDQQRKAEVTQKRAEAVKTMVESGAITKEQGTQLLVDWEELPKAFISEDVTPEETVTDMEKPGTNPEADTGPLVNKILAEASQQPVVEAPTTPEALAKKIVSDAKPVAPKSTGLVQRVLNLFRGRGAA